MRLLTFITMLTAAAMLRAGEFSDTLSTLPRVAPGTELGTIKVGSRTYDEVRIKSYDSRSVIFTHSGGLGSARLRDLTPDLQGLFGYDPSQPEPSSAGKIAPLQNKSSPALTTLPKPVETMEVSRQSDPAAFDSLVSAFGTEPELRAKQNLQSEFARFSFTAKSQGRRLSCAIFSVVSALEFQNAKTTGSPQKLSEDYLLWATRRITDHAPSGIDKNAVDSPPGSGPKTVTSDQGFSLSEVVSALRAYGIATQSEMANPGAGSSGVSVAPDETLVATARTRRMVDVLPVPGRQNQTVLANVIQALNHGYPVPIGLRWPVERSIRAGFLNDQAPKPDAFHAVTLVGYECAGSRPEDVIFIFKNSYGAAWGVDGYGRATWSYLEQNLTDAIVLNVGPGAQKSSGTSKQ